MPHLRAGPARPAQGRARSGARGQCPGGVTRRASDALTPAAPGHAHGARARSPSAVAVGPWSRPRGAPRVLSAVAPLPPPAPRLGAPGRIHGGRTRAVTRTQALGGSTVGGRAAPASALAHRGPRPGLLGARPRPRPTVAQAVGVEHGTRPLSSRRAPATARHAQGPRTERHGAACPASGAHPAARSACGLPRLTRPCAHGVGRPLGRAPWRRLEHGTPPPGGRSQGVPWGTAGGAEKRFEPIFKTALAVCGTDEPWATARLARRAAWAAPQGVEKPRRTGRGGAPPPPPTALPAGIAPFLRMLKTGHKVQTLAPYSQLVPLFCRGRGAHAACQASERRRCPLGTQQAARRALRGPPEHPHAMRRTRRPGASQGLTRTGAKGGSDATGARR